MTNNEIKRIIEDLSSIRRSINRKNGNAYMTQLQIRHLEEMFYKNYGVKLKIERLSDFEHYEQSFRRELARNESREQMNQNEPHYKRKRAAYYGTHGCPGLHFISIVGVFSAQEQREIESLDGILQKWFDKVGFQFLRYHDYLILAANVSPDDSRNGSITMVAIEGTSEMSDILDLINERPFLKDKFDRICAKYKLTMPEL